MLLANLGLLLLITISDPELHLYTVHSPHPLSVFEDA